MANFSPIYRETLDNEGGFVNDPNDHGEMTYRGIARAFQKDWQGWPIIDEILRKRKIEPDEIIEDANLKIAVRQFYEGFWRRSKAGQINDQSIAHIYFDFFVMSPKGAAETMQRALNWLGYKVAVDGVVGPQTLAAINSVSNPEELFNQYKNARIAYHEARAEQPGQAKFRKGWVNRTLEFVYKKKAACC
jgi:lysozyme family protein